MFNRSLLDCPRKVSQQPVKLIATISRLSSDAFQILKRLFEKQNKNTTRQEAMLSTKGRIEPTGPPSTSPASILSSPQSPRGLPAHPCSITPRPAARNSLRPDLGISRGRSGVHAASRRPRGRTRAVPPVPAPLTAGLPAESHPRRQSGRPRPAQGPLSAHVGSVTRHVTCLSGSRQHEGHKNLEREGTSSTE